jgi:hypothetical protein
MTSITADKRMSTALKQVKERTVIRDRQGKIIGFFIPQNHPLVVTRLDGDEIERRKRSKEKGIPHKEVMRHMRLLDAEIERRRRAGERKLTGDEAVAFAQRLRTKSRKKQNRDKPGEKNQWVPSLQIRQ